MLIDYANGARWEKLITKSLPLLEQFSLDISDRVSSDIINIDNIIQSFSTPFWIIERQWFIIVDCTQLVDSEFLLYTIPRPKNNNFDMQLYQMQTGSTIPSTFKNVYAKIDRLDITLSNIHLPLIVRQFIDVKSLTLYSQLTSVDNTTTKIINDLSILVTFSNLNHLHLIDKCYPSKLLEVILTEASNIITLTVPYCVLLDMNLINDKICSNLTSVTVTMNNNDEHFNVKILERMSFIFENVLILSFELTNIDDLYLILPLTLRKMKKIGELSVCLKNGIFSECFQHWLKTYLNLNDLLSTMSIEYDNLFNNLLLTQ
ncbi:unnamed protein product [Didymodactylos carnosus]|nr:unnamed protein product [Didymodactylos carnosus]CAF4150672.1 unnamed protein product [Didymodactylos carnosus]